MGSFGLYLLSVSNTQNPILLSSYDTPDDTRYVTIINGLVYVADGNGGLQIVDISNPQNPSLVSSYVTPGSAQSVTVVGGIAYVTNVEAGLQIINIANPQNSSLSGSYDTPGTANSIIEEDDIAYVADGVSGLQIVNVNHPQNPVLLGSIETAGSALNVGVESNLACVAEADSGMQIIDVSNPQNPLLMGTYQCYARSVVVVDSLAYVAENMGLQIINIANPQNPVMLGYWTPFEAMGVGVSVDVVGDTAYLIFSGFALVYFYSDLVVIDVSNPLDPHQLGGCNCTLTVGVRSVEVIDDYAYVAGLGSGLQIIDVSNPASPSIINSILPHPTSSIYCCTANSDYLFISDSNWNEISIYDISTPQTPFLIDRYAWNLPSTDMFADGSVLYTANGLSGLYIHHLSAVDVDDAIHIPPTSLQISNYPNPFNPETTISYTLPSSGMVSLEIYNSRGQLVRSLLSEEQTAGEHSLIWNGRDDSGHSVASGLYLCRIACNGKQETRKMLLLK